MARIAALQLHATQQLRVGRDDDRRDQPEHCGECGRQKDAGAEQHARGQRDTDRVVAGRPEQVLLLVTAGSAIPLEGIKETQRSL